MQLCVAFVHGSGARPFLSGLVLQCAFRKLCRMFAGMNQEQIFTKLQADKVQMQQEMIQTKQLMDQANAADATGVGGAKGDDWHQGKGGWEHGGKGGNGRVVLDGNIFVSVKSLMEHL